MHAFAIRYTSPLRLGSDIFPPFTVPGLIVVRASPTYDNAECVTVALCKLLMPRSIWIIYHNLPHPCNTFCHITCQFMPDLLQRHATLPPYATL